MSIQKYIYDSSSLSYVPVKKSLKKKVRNGFIFVGSSLSIGVVGFAIAATTFSTPKEKVQAKLLKDLESNQTILENRINDIRDEFEVLISYDDSLYRTMLGVNSLSSDVRNAGIGGTNKYPELSANSDLSEITDAFMDLDQLVAEMSVQKSSYNALFKSANFNIDRMNHLPAIIPIANWDLKRVGSGFSPRRFHPILNVWREHKGIDFVAPTGTEIYSPADGVVEKVITSSSYGKLVVINHGYGLKTYFAHLSKFECKRKDKVKRGDLIGLVGSTGLSSGPHLHYEVHLNGRAVDPVDYFFNDLTSEDYKAVVEHTDGITTCME